MNIAQFVGREGDVAAITNDLNDESIRNGFFDAVQMKQMFGSSIGPTLNALLATHLGHDDAQEVSAIAAFRHHLGRDFLFVEARERVETAVVPRFEQAALVGGDREIAEARLEKIDDVGLYTVDGEVSGREKHVV